MRKGILIIGLAILFSPIQVFAAFDACREYFPNNKVPTVSQSGRDLCFDGFAVYYSPQDKKPIYAVEKLNSKILSLAPQARTNQFYEEARLRANERSRLEDYSNSGYDRGHNSEAATKRSPEAMAQSFSLANIAPQAPDFNRGTWAKDVEKPTRKYIQRALGDVFVYTGSVGNAGVIGKSRVVIPQYFYKLIYDQSSNRAWAFWLPNTNDAHMSKEAIISYPELVQRTGIDFGLTNTSK